MMDRKIIIPTMILGLATIAGVAAYTGSASADDTNQRAAMSETLSEKLGVEKSKVDAAFDEIRTERRAEREKQMAANLDKAVSDGVITTEQKQKLLDKHTEMKAEMEKRRTETEQWFKDNGIDQTKLRDYGVGMGGKGHSHGMGMHRMR